MWNPVTTARAIAHELRAAMRVVDPSSYPAVAGDVLAYRALRALVRRGSAATRRIRLRDGTVVTYRRTRGDIQTVREVLLDDIYRLPAPLATFQPRTVVDLGANIGLASLAFARRYRPQQLVLVEPDPENARLAHTNLGDNRIRGEIVEAAIGPADGRELFAPGAEANLGRLRDAGAAREVDVVSMRTLVERHLNGKPIDLLKIDIEGGEQALLTESSDWLDCVSVIVVEFHAGLVDYPRLVRELVDRGFVFFEASEIGTWTDTLARPDSLTAGVQAGV